jgi:hypothetical protein
MCNKRGKEIGRLGRVCRGESKPSCWCLYVCSECNGTELRIKVTLKMKMQIE